MEFPFILFCSKVFREFHAFEAVKKFYGANMNPKIFLQISTPPKALALRKSASIEVLWSRWAIPVRAVGVRIPEEEIKR
jgi:hypothetical protein